MSNSTSSPEFFDDKYRRSSDPWAFASSDYEQSRYASMLTATGNRRYRKAFEPGCSVGVFTAMLASRCDEIVATDISAVAVQYAMERCTDLENVTILCERLPDYIPAGPLDLVILSEIGYYFHEEMLRALGSELVNRLSASGVLLASHWLGHSKDHVLSGDEVHAALRSTDGLALDHEERHTGFRLDRWVKA